MFDDSKTIQKDTQEIIPLFKQKSGHDSLLQINKFETKQEDNDSDSLQRIVVKRKVLTPQPQSTGSFSQVLEKQNAFNRNNLNVITTENNRKQMRRHQSYVKSRIGQSSEDEMPLVQLQNQSVMRRIFNKIRIEVLVKTFVNNMIFLLNKDKWSVFENNQLFFNIIHDKSAVFDESKQTQVQTSHHQSMHLMKSNQINLSTINSRKSYFISKGIQHYFKQILNKITVFSPFSKFRTVWDQIQLLCLGFFFVVIPILISFNLPIIDVERTNTIHRILLVFLALDILINFNTSLFQQGREIKSRLIIAHHYIKHAFALDCVTLLCLIVFLFQEEESDEKYLRKFMNIILVLFFLRYKQFERVLKKIEIQYHFSPEISQILRLTNLFMMNIYIIHLCACFWILIAKLEISNGSSSTWMHKLNIQDEQWYIQFLNSFYFNTVTMVTVGYGDISPQTNFERFCSILTVLSACGVFAYSISEVTLFKKCFLFSRVYVQKKLNKVYDYYRLNSIFIQVGNIFLEMNKSFKKRKRNMFIINNYMKKKRITSDLQYQIRHYLEYYWNESLSENSSKEQSIINQLSNNLKENLLIEANRILVLESPFFRENFSFKTILKTVSLISDQRCTPEEIVYLKGDRDDSSIYFIEKGSVQYFHTIDENSQNKQFIQCNTLRTGEYFGEVSFFTGSERLQNVRSLEFTTLIKIDRNKFLEVIQECPQDYEKYCLIRDDIIINGNIAYTQKKCTYCIQEESLDPNHMPTLCPMVHYIPNKKRTRKLLKRNQDNKFNSMGRIEQVRGEQNRMLFQFQGEIQEYIQMNGLQNDTDEELNELTHSSSQSSDENIILQQSSSTNSDDPDSFNASSQISQRNSQQKIPLASQKKKKKKKIKNQEDVEEENTSLSKEKMKSSIVEEDILDIEYYTNKDTKEQLLSNSDHNTSYDKAELMEEFKMQQQLNADDLIILNSKNVLQKQDKLVNQVKPFITNSMKKTIDTLPEASNIPNLYQTNNQFNTSKMDNHLLEINNNHNLPEPNNYLNLQDTNNILNLPESNNNLNSNETNNSLNLMQKNQNQSETMNGLGVSSHNNISTPLIKNQSHQIKIIDINQYADQKQTNARQQDNLQQKEVAISQQQTLKNEDCDTSLKIQKQQYKISKQTVKQRTMNSIGQSVKFKLPKNQYKHRSSKSLQELNRQITDLIKVSEGSSHTNNGISTNYGSNKLINNQSSSKKKILPAVKKRYSQGQEMSNLETNCQFDKNNSDKKEVKSYEHIEQQQQRFNTQIDTIVNKFQKIQDILTIQNKQHLQNQLNRFHHSSNNQNNTSLKEFDRMKAYEIYFPTNNFDIVLSQYNQKVNSKNKKKKNQFQTSTTPIIKQQRNSLLSHQNTTVFQDLFQQNTLNRLKYLRNDYTRNSITESFSKIQKQDIKLGENSDQQNSPKQKKNILLQGNGQQEDETPPNNINKSQTPKQVSRNNQLDMSISEQAHSLIIPNYFGLQSAQESQTSFTNTKKSRFGNRTSIFKNQDPEQVSQNKSPVSSIKNNEVNSNKQNIV